MRLRTDGRAVSAVVAKTFAAAIAVLYVASVSGLLLGSVVPGHEAAAGEELSDRVLATAAQTVEQSTPDTNGTVNTTVAVDLPATIESHSYRIVAEDGELRLVHPTDRIETSTSLSLPPGTAVEAGVWHSGSAFRIRVSGSPTNRTVSLEP